MSKGVVKDPYTNQEAVICNENYFSKLREKEKGTGSESGRRILPKDEFQISLMNIKRREENITLMNAVQIGLRQYSLFEIFRNKTMGQFH